VACTDGPTGRAVKENTIEIGGAFALTGDAASWGVEEQRAVMLAFEEANAHGGVRGREIHLVAEDTRSDMKDTLSAVKKLIEIDGVQAIIGPTWGDTFGAAVAPIGEEHKVVQISPSAALETVEYGKTEFPYYFSTYYPQASEIKTEIAFLKKLGAQKTVSIRDSDQFNVQFNDKFNEEARASGIDVAAVIDIPSETSDYRTMLLKAQQHKSDTLVVNIFQVEQLGLLIRQANEIGMDVIVVSSTSTQTTKLIDDYGVYAENKIFYSYPALETDAFRAFEAAYEKRWGEKPSTAAAGTAYDAARAVIAALRTGAISGEEVRVALNNLEIEGTIVPTLSFTPVGQIVEATYVMRTVHNREFITIE
jgi:branched-chain amino acid transport system substrate-binding protein